MILIISKHFLFLYGGSKKIILNFFLFFYKLKLFKILKHLEKIAVLFSEFKFVIFFFKFTKAFSHFLQKKL